MAEFNQDTVADKDFLLKRYPIKRAKVSSTDRKPALFTPQTALGHARQSIAATLRVPAALALAFSTAWDIRQRLGRKSVFPARDPEGDKDQADLIHNSRQLLAQLASLLPAADVIALARLAIMMTASPPDAECFNRLQHQREYADEAVSRG